MVLVKRLGWNRWSRLGSYVLF